MTTKNEMTLIENESASQENYVPVQKAEVVEEMPSSIPQGSFVFRILEKKDGDYYKAVINPSEIRAFELKKKIVELYENL